MNEHKTPGVMMANIINTMITSDENSLLDQLKTNGHNFKEGKEVFIKNANVISDVSMTDGSTQVQGMFEAMGVAKPPQPLSILDILPTSRIDKGYLHTVEQTAQTVAAGVRSEGGAINQGDREYTEATFKPVIVSGYIDVTNESLDDVVFLKTELEGGLRREVRRAISNQVINGTGVAPQMKGLFTVATPFAAGAFATNVPTPTYSDVLKVAGNMIMQANYKPTIALVNPQDYTSMMLGLNAMSTLPFIVLYTTDVAVGKYLLFDTNVTRLFIVEDSLWFSEQNADNALNNRVSVIHTTRTIFKINSVDAPAIVHGDFAADLAAITAA